MDVHTSCSADSDYAVSVRNDGIRFSCGAGRPRDVPLHDGSPLCLMTLKQESPRKNSVADASRFRSGRLHSSAAKPTSAPSLRYRAYMVIPENVSAA
jgi:hypothetical protein